jgi:hypothetical protein
MHQTLGNKNREPSVICTHLQIHKPRLTVEFVLIFTAVLGLLLGTAVYFLDRDWSSALFLAPYIEYQWPRYAVFGVLGRNLPSLLHAYAICAFLLVALWPWPRLRPWICLLWFSLAAFLESIQHDTVYMWFVDYEGLWGEIPLIEFLKGYALQGRFDIVDLIASGIGCLVAMTITFACSHNIHRSQI